VHPIDAIVKLSAGADPDGFLLHLPGTPAIRQRSASQPCALFRWMTPGEQQGLFGRNSHFLRTSPLVKSGIAGR
jgi:hypothetical protein